jgi:C-terminal processing protease CtpA/Prc
LNDPRYLLFCARVVRRIIWPSALCLLILAAGAPRQSVRAQSIGLLRDRGRLMLTVIKKDIKDNYYDRSFHGVDLDAHFKAAEEKIKTANSNGQIFRIIAGALDVFNDSHTFLLPPDRASRTDYGWQMQMIGDKPYIIAVKPGSDAEAQGLKVGDEIYSLDGFEPTRDNLWKMKYVYYGLEPRSGVRLVVIGKDGQQRELLVKSKISTGKRLRDVFNEMFDLIREADASARLYRQRYEEVGEDLFIWKMPDFMIEDTKVDAIMDKARQHKAIIFDLRGNGGGAVSALERLAGYFFDHDLKIADLKGRKEMKPQVAKTRGDRVFKGKVIVLVDHQSASASEIFARLMQLEKRATVIGDRTAGAVMQSRLYDHELGTDDVIFYGASVTEADLIMSDGQSLEHTGVTPDELLLPKAADLAANRDPVLAHAAELLGVKLEADKAGALFPVEWRK